MGRTSKILSHSWRQLTDAAAHCYNSIRSKYTDYTKLMINPCHHTTKYRRQANPSTFYWPLPAVIFAAKPEMCLFYHHSLDITFNEKRIQQKYVWIHVIWTHNTLQTATWQSCRVPRYTGPSCVVQKKNTQSHSSGKQTLESFIRELIRRKSRHSKNLVARHLGTLPSRSLCSVHHTSRLTKLDKRLHETPTPSQ